MNKRGNLININKKIKKNQGKHTLEQSNLNVVTMEFNLFGWTKIWVINSLIPMLVTFSLKQNF